MGSSTQGPRYWFPAKRYGWGWDLPVIWQGWMVFAAQNLAIFALFLLVSPAQHFAFFVCGLVTTALLSFSVHWLKGEPPRWRWGK